MHRKRIFSFSVPVYGAALVWILAFVFSMPMQAQERNKKEARKAYNQALDYVTRGQYEPALAYTDAALDFDNSFSDALLLRAKIKVELGNKESATSDFLALKEIRPELGEVDFYLAYIRFPGQADSSLIAHFDEAIRKGYKIPEAYYYRGLLNQQFGMHSKAIADFTEAINRRQDYALAYHNRASSKRLLGDMQGALQDYRLAVGIDHNFPQAFNNMGSVKIILGDFEGAIEDYTVAVNLDPQFFIAFNNRGCAYYSLGKYEEALTDFDKAIEMNATYIPALNNRADVFGKQEKYSEATEIFDGIINSDADFPKAYLNRGLIRELQGDLVGACADWKKASELGLKEADAYLKECK